MSPNQIASGLRTINGTAKAESKERAELERFGVKWPMAQPVN